MNAIFSCFSSLVTTLVLKPLDLLLFGGSGILWRPRSAFTEGVQEHLKKWYDDATPEQRAAFMASGSSRLTSFNTDEEEANPCDPTPTFENVQDPAWQALWASPGNAISAVGLDLTGSPGNDISAVGLDLTSDDPV